METRSITRRLYTINLFLSALSEIETERELDIWQPDYVEYLHRYFGDWLSWYPSRFREFRLPYHHQLLFADLDFFRFGWQCWLNQHYRGTVPVTGLYWKIEN